MRGLATVVGVVLIGVILVDAFETIVLPRRIRRRLGFTPVFYRITWMPVSLVARRLKRNAREDFLSFFGPLSLLLLLSTWAVALITGFALLQWGVATALIEPGQNRGLSSYLYFSGTTFFTLGFGDLTPLNPLGRALAVIEAGTGFAFLAAVISYLPVLYQSFSRREIAITLLDARAGSPPSAAEFLRRQGGEERLHELHLFLRDWELWSAELLESHLSYPVLAFYRSQHDRQSWLYALTMVLDTCALLLAIGDERLQRSAQLTFAMARHTALDLAQIFTSEPNSFPPDRLPPDVLERLSRVLLQTGLAADPVQITPQFKQLRDQYEPYVAALGSYLLMDLPPLVPDDDVDDWRSSAWEKSLAID